MNINMLLLTLSGGIFTIISAGFAAPIGAKKPVVSPDKTLLFQVERMSDYTDPFSGKMRLRLSDTKTATATKQRIVEGTRVRTMSAPVWLDNIWVGFDYNISKDSAGYVFFNSQTHEAYVMEADITIAADTEKSEMQSLTFTQYTERKSATQTLQNLTYPAANRSLFPLYLPTSDKLADIEVPTVEFVHEVQAALAEYQALCTAKRATAITPEIGSESFNTRTNRAAFLAGMDTTPTLMILPLDAKTPKDALSKAQMLELPAEVKLSSNTSDERTDVADENHDDPTAVRFTTVADQTGKFVIAKEVYDETLQTTQLRSYYETDVKATTVTLVKQLGIRSEE